MYGNILYGCGSLSTPQKNRYIQSFVKYVNSVLNVIFYKKKKNVLISENDNSASYDYDLLIIKRTKNVSNTYLHQSQQLLKNYEK